MMNRKLFFLLVLWTVCPIGAQEAPSSLIEQADAVFAHRTEKTGTPEALALYEKVLIEDPSSVEAMWKAARAYYWMADHAESKREKIALFQKGIGLAEKAVSADPKSVDAHFWLGGLYGSYGEAKGIMKSLGMVRPIRREMDAINRLNDRYQGGAGYRVLGIVDYKVPGFAGGSKKRALEQLNKALAIGPDNPFNRYYIAEFCWTIGEKEKALAHLEVLQTLSPSDEVDEPDLKMIQTKGTSLKKKL